MYDTIIPNCTCTDISISTENVYSPGHFLLYCYLSVSHTIITQCTVTTDSTNATHVHNTVISYIQETSLVIKAALHSCLRTCTIRIYLTTCDISLYAWNNSYMNSLTNHFSANKGIIIGMAVAIIIHGINGMGHCHVGTEMLWSDTYHTTVTMVQYTIHKNCNLLLWIYIILLLCVHCGQLGYVARESYMCVHQLYNKLLHAPRVILYVLLSVSLPCQ